ncbi:unnamed protein product, partial [Symbiodinium necroappetens]
KGDLKKNENEEQPPRSAAGDLCQVPEDDQKKRTVAERSDKNCKPIGPKREEAAADLCQTAAAMDHRLPAKLGPFRIVPSMNCLESKNKIHLPSLPPIPAALRALKPIEHHLLAMARISQVVLDKLPSGGPSGQWGRMYAVLMQDPCICDVLEGELQTQHLLYRSNLAVQDVITKMSAILQQRSSEATTRPTAVSEELQQAGTEEDDHQFTYLVPKDPKVPRADLVELRQTRGSAQLADDIDVKFFPHLFPDGTNGWKDAYRSFAQYARKRLLGQDGRFEQSASYIMWLLETQLKKRLSGNVNVR